MATDPSPRDGPNGPSWAAAGAAFELAGSVGGGCLLGFFLDRWLDTGPWGLLAGALLGMIIGMAALIRMALRARDPEK